jgi:nitrogen fixation-related uncharacterized protein
MLTPLDVLAVVALVCVILLALRLLWKSISGQNDEES